MRRRFQKQQPKNAVDKNSTVSSASIVYCGKGYKDYPTLSIENKYATIGRFTKKLPLWTATKESQRHPMGQLSLGKECRIAAEARVVAKALNVERGGGRGRPQSMGAAARQMGISVEEEEESGDEGTIIADVYPSNWQQRVTMSELKQDQTGRGVLFQPTLSANRNSTGSAGSNQTSSGFESAKSTSSYQLAGSASSGSCSSGIGCTGLTHAVLVPDSDAASPSSLLSSSGSSTQGRSSAYFSLSDGLDYSIWSVGTLMAQRSSKGSISGCSRMNIAEMVAKGIPEPEIFAEWLQRLCLSEYLALFLSQGYDLPTLARASPEDLTTLGITRPEDRKRLIQDIQCWRNLQDYWPCNYKPEENLRDWLSAIGLKQYVDLFEQQGYLSMGEFEQLEAEDFEDIGVKKLGHIKRICLALKKLKNTRGNASYHHNVNTSKETSLDKISAEPATSSSIQSTTMIQPILRRHQAHQHHQSNEYRTSLSEVFLDQKHTLQENEKRSQFRNSPFGVDPLGDRRSAKGYPPPRLNLYRTSQIIAQLPKEPPPVLDDEDEENVVDSNISDHIPPPPAPIPLSPTMSMCTTLPSSSSLSASVPGRFFSSNSQPTTPRNVQKMLPSLINDSYLHGHHHINSTYKNMFHQ